MYTMANSQKSFLIHFNSYNMICDLVFWAKETLDNHSQISTYTSKYISIVM